MCSPDIEWSEEQDLHPEAWTASEGTGYRRDLLLCNRERIELAFETAIAKGLDDPVVLVLDLQDARAARLAVQTGLSREKLERMNAQCERDDVVPTLILFAPRWAVMILVGSATPLSPRGIAKPNPPGTFRVVAVAAGGNAFADFPIPPRSSIDWNP